MSDAPTDPNWTKITHETSHLLALSVHEFRNTLSVLGGYLRMLLKDRTGTLTDSQRHSFLQEVEKSYNRMAVLVEETSDLSLITAGNVELKRQPADLHAALRAAVEQLPPLRDGREITIELELGSDPAPISASTKRLIDALKWILVALRRELVTSNRLLVRERSITYDGTAVYELKIGDEETLAALDAEVGENDGRLVFDEWRGGNGMLLPIARRILDAHGGHIWAPPNNPPDPKGKIEPRKAGARIVLPRG